tara:strand:+ start:145 stop:609 length:465 start_codon:yes stop_codon:yes gene_type:complete
MLVYKVAKIGYYNNKQTNNTSNKMTDTITLNFDLLNGLEPGTDEFGQANLKMHMDFALDILNDICFEAALAHSEGKVETPVVEASAFPRYIAKKMLDESEEAARVWLNTSDTIFPEVVKHWLNVNAVAYITSDGGLWIDWQELVAKMEEEEAAA